MEDAEEISPEWPDAWVEPEPLPTRRRVPWWVRVVGVLAVLSMVMLPIWNAVQASTPRLARNGLDVCPLDYCIVQEAIRDAGLGVAMAGASTTLVDDDDAQRVADQMSLILGGRPVEVSVVDDLPGSVGGRYDPTDGSIVIDRPATLWVIAHEVAHSVAPGHGERFQAALITLTEAFGDISADDP